jgi:hypothetical protein
VANSPGARRVPQQWDDIHIELILPPNTEEWADDLLETIDCNTAVERTDEALIARFEIAGNCDGASNLRTVLTDVEDAMQEGDISLNEFEVKVTSHPNHKERESG